MNGFFGAQTSQQDLRARLAQRRRRNGHTRPMSMPMVLPGYSPQMGESDMGIVGAMGGDSLDDIIMLNDMEIHRRQSLPHYYPDQNVGGGSVMMGFGANNSNAACFQFGGPVSGPGNAYLRREPAGEMGMHGGYTGMPPGMDILNDQSMDFNSFLHGTDALNIGSGARDFPPMPADMVHDMFRYAPITMDALSEDDAALQIYPNSDFSQPFGNANLERMSNDFMMPIMPELAIPDDSMMASPTKTSINQNPAYIPPPSLSMIPSLSPQNSYGLVDSAPLVKTESSSKYPDIYSSSGFDMLGALVKVATRTNPEIDIGKVDMSCAFLVCDITQDDCPIVYVSEIFERLTGYTKHEILGRNCRFMQSPEGKVQAGVRREFVDNDSIYYLKRRIEEKKEAQRSVINYRKGGQPFMNLLTMIPISGEDGDEIKYFVGFQVDLVEKPTSVQGKSSSGLYTVDYSQGMLPKYVWSPPSAQRDDAQLISRDDVSAVLSSICHTEPELTQRMWDKMLLENTDDVIHVLSLKGLFLYLSPSCQRILEYDPSELVGTALSSICHPSDIVPIMRELKDTSTGASVNVVFRIRRKRGGYTWFESHGSLCREQGKGRKFVILVGRERPIYTLARQDIEAAGGIRESEIWTKLSTAGMFLFVSSNVRTLLDRSPEDLIGTSMQVLMRPESKVSFARSLEKARTGKRVTQTHEILNKRGLALQAQTTLYPGDASEGQKPTFLVAQTRLPKTPLRAMAPGGSQGNSKLPLTKPQLEKSTSLGYPPGLTSEQLAHDPLSSSSSPLIPGQITKAGNHGLAIGTQDRALASENNIFDELKTTRCTSWQFELRQMEKNNRLLAEELAVLLSNKKKRKRRKGAGPLQKDCANCHTRATPEWRRGPSGQRDLCNSCGLRWAKQTGRVSPRNSKHSGGDAASIAHSSPLQKEAPRTASLFNTLGMNSNPKEKMAEGTTGDGPARLKHLGMPVREQSLGFRDGGKRRIVVIKEGEEPGD
ncbi:PYP-like sensor (PAS) [Venustampulla echinocandica]|uniref:PYP-like sensor (PAS) n=1 Tax=Venustampulla echinocandica TaxID=2656787 RepID=A0A370TDS3_9HELO|nr:PYP-like sensor (PAS) [Venustampulla echinocandica]RDL32615.1 PYP-like sensor (PAS) [Venustampulla echinocandica]